MDILLVNQTQATRPISPISKVILHPQDNMRDTPTIHHRTTRSILPRVANTHTRLHMAVTVEDLMEELRHQRRATILLTPLSLQLRLRTKVREEKGSNRDRQRNRRKVTLNQSRGKIG
uniref:Uncharacterized protein n=1 Tax=Dendroctonus ponderosae TaxID=77166 RepID=A0AAR5NWR0_DENPD